MEELLVFLTLCGQNSEEVRTELYRAKELGIRNFEIREDLLPFNVIAGEKVSNNFIKYLRQINNDNENPRIIFTAAKGLSIKDNEKSLRDLWLVLEFLAEIKSEIYIDLDFSIEKPILVSARDMVRAKDLGLIISVHKYESLPGYEETLTLLKDMKVHDPDIIKFAAMIRNKEGLEVLRRASGDFKRLYKGQKLAIIGMGKEGMETRLKPVSFASCLAYTSFGSKAAPGQVEPEKYLKALKDKTLS